MECYFLIGLYTSVFWVISFIFNFVVFNIQNRQGHVLECQNVSYFAIYISHIFMASVFILAFWFLLFAGLDKNKKETLNGPAGHII